MTTILIVEDEPSLLTLLSYNLEKEGYQVLTAADGDKGLEAAAAHEPDLVVLDWMLPGRSGLEVCRQLRRSASPRRIPVLMLTARGEEADKVRGLDVGADDYMTKPFSLPELLARIRALLRRSQPARQRGSLDHGDIHLDLTTHKVTRAGQPLHLGPTEFRLLQFFMQHPQCVFSREELLAEVWGRDIFVEPRTVDVHIRRLRKVLMEGGRPDPIRTVRSAGYALDDAESG